MKEHLAKTVEDVAMMTMEANKMPKDEQMKDHAEKKGADSDTETVVYGESLRVDRAVREAQEQIQNIEDQVSEIDFITNDEQFRIMVKGPQVKKGAPPLSCTMLRPSSPSHARTHTFTLYGA